MQAVNLHFAWAWMLAGMVLGAGVGLFFHRADWLGGFGSWRRRMVRLAHIAFLGTGLLNLGFALSVGELTAGHGGDVMIGTASVLFILGAATMPAVCLLAAWRQPFRHLFFVPALSLIIATAAFLYRGLVA
jgi:hypothetical protein